MPGKKFRIEMKSITSIRAKVIAPKKRGVGFPVAARL